jgi:hypothetical protein
MDLKMQHVSYVLIHMVLPIASGILQFVAILTAGFHSSISRQATDADLGGAFSHF